MEISARDLYRATLYVLCDIEVKTDALFVHSRDDAEDEMLALAAQALQQRRAPYVVINGTRKCDWKKVKVEYGGFEMWHTILRKLGVPKNRIVAIPSPALFTDAESEKILTMAKERGWRSLAISALPYHQLRCFLSIIAAMKRLGIFLDVYNLTLRSLEWDAVVAKRLLGGGKESGTRSTHIDREYDRIVRYMDTGDHVQLATFQEMFQYLNDRNTRTQSR